jgi:hypothetical protein
MTSPRLIDPDPEPDLPVPGDTGFAIDYCPLQFHGTAHRVDVAWEFREHAIASILGDTPGILADLRVDELAAMRPEALVGAFLVSPISREQPATSAAKTAARRRVWLMTLAGASGKKACNAVDESPGRRDRLLRFGISHVGL